MNPTWPAWQDFWSFISDHRSITSWVAKAFIAAPLIDIILGFGPPWPTGTAVSVLTSLVEALVLMGSFMFWKRVTWRRSTFLTGIAFAILLFLIYILLFDLFVYSAPSEEAREVKGFRYRGDIESMIYMGATERELLQSGGYDPLMVWAPWTVYTMRVVVLISWLSGFVALAITMSSFVLSQRRAVVLGEC